MYYPLEESHQALPGFYKITDIMSKSYSIKATQGLNVKDYNLFDSSEHVDNLSPTYMGILKIFKEIFKQVDMSKIINNNKRTATCQVIERKSKLTAKPS